MVGVWAVLRVAMVGLAIAAEDPAGVRGSHLIVIVVDVVHADVSQSHALPPGAPPPDGERPLPTRRARGSEEGRAFMSMPSTVMHSIEPSWERALWSEGVDPENRLYHGG